MNDKLVERSKTERKRAVALRYEPGQKPAPVVVAAGSGHIADKIIASAKENGIPLQEEPELVELLACLDIGQVIPPELYVAVAEVLAFVYQVNRKYVRVK